MSETFEEWRVTGQPVLGYLGYDFTWSPDRNPHLGDPEKAARSFVAAIAKEGGWENGPHLTKRTVTRTDWEPVGAEHAAQGSARPQEATNGPDAYPSEGEAQNDAQRAHQ